jgi:hypothetical protein
VIIEFIGDNFFFGTPASHKETRFVWVRHVLSDEIGVVREHFKAEKFSSAGWAGAYGRRTFPWVSLSLIFWRRPWKYSSTPASLDVATVTHDHNHPPRNSANLNSVYGGTQFLQVRKASIEDDCPYLEDGRFQPRKEDYNSVKAVISIGYQGCKCEGTWFLFLGKIAHVNDLSQYGVCMLEHLYYIGKNVSSRREEKQNWREGAQQHPRWGCRSSVFCKARVVYFLVHSMKLQVRMKGQMRMSILVSIFVSLKIDETDLSPSHPHQKLEL